MTLIFLLIILICQVTPSAVAQGPLTTQPSPNEAQEAQRLEAEINAIRSSLNAAQPGSMVSSLSSASQPSNRVNLLMQLGVALQRLNHLKPDGGQRIPEAIQAYKSVLEALEANAQSLMLNSDTAAQVRSKADRIMSSMIYSDVFSVSTRSMRPDQWQPRSPLPRRLPPP